ncbi:lasso peptide biosynthesis PqqD family chaperone [Streptomyces sp. NBC_00341]|uniref:lasso peptide biosynthesis PqqD family chaperone n=1 Tax=unclassified Streptomyces TaxID=2593676 RepID=UPI003091CBAA|nr:lasso peptide biosynthesis PqqD family chaperone [Streptomyces sp. NBC_00341]
MRSDVACCPTEDGTVLLDERDGRYWQLNATGTTVLQALLDGATPHQVAERLASTRPVTSEQAAADITALIDHLSRAGLIEDAR